MLHFKTSEESSRKHFPLEFTYVVVVSVDQSDSEALGALLNCLVHHHVVSSIVTRLPREACLGFPCEAPRTSVSCIHGLYALLWLSWGGVNGMGLTVPQIVGLVSKQGLLGYGVGVAEWSWETLGQTGKREAWFVCLQRKWNVFVFISI